MGKRGNSPRGATTSGGLEVAMSEKLANVSAHRRRLHGLGKGFDMSASISKGEQSLGEVDHAAIAHGKKEDLNERGDRSTSRSRCVVCDSRYYRI
jgi:hypothetical protein